ncbi:hypothetical protein HELRODRAFT_161742 [Helobdella robusta]|uniref:Uncharacterized protein n=1 Tax=Helobdella robusta TaxID=6412 RepID=T1ERV2_HELRO|nr:hypothetical protein HELRODRAFT_161742 [Helobdella robusta]ESO02470.1 hypothetical protein HELRODRAFT_161742 [Helobdella robusta]
MQLNTIQLDNSIPDRTVQYKAIQINAKHSSVQNSDDASSCQRETAIKFADQNEDGPFDLILHTGRITLGDCCKSFSEVMTLARPEELKIACRRNPLLLVSI